MSKISITSVALNLHTDLDTIGKYMDSPEVVRALISTARTKIHEIDGYLGDIEAALPGFQQSASLVSITKPN